MKAVNIFAQPRIAEEFELYCLFSFIIRTLYNTLKRKTAPYMKVERGKLKYFQLNMKIPVYIIHFINCQLPKTKHKRNETHLNLTSLYHMKH